MGYPVLDWLKLRDYLWKLTCEKGPEAQLDMLKRRLEPERPEGMSPLHCDD